MSLSSAIQTLDLRVVIASLAGPDATRGLGPGGGTIHDPRPGCSERDPSFSVWRRPNGVWMWKRHGGDDASGNAFHLLLAFRYTPRQAREELLRLAGLRSTFDEVQRDGRPYDVLEDAREALSHLVPLSEAELRQARALCTSLRPGMDAAEGLAARGLWTPEGLACAVLRNDLTRFGRTVAQMGALVFAVRGPDGRVLNLKVRNLHGTGKDALPRYVYLRAHHGSPAWTNPHFGTAPRVLLVEGELNAAAAWRAAGGTLDVQGLAGAKTWPHLHGLQDRHVLIHMDADQEGEAGRARLHDLAHRLGAEQITHLPRLDPGVDYCDVLGQGGSAALRGLLAA